MLLGVLALIVPLWPEFAPEWRIGACSSWPLASKSSTVPTFQCLLAPGRVVRGRHHPGDGLLLMTLPVLASKAMTLLIAVWFAMDGVRYAVRGVRAARGGSARVGPAAAWGISG